MNRQNPLFSPASIGLTVLFLVILGLGTYRSGGKAFNPGKLSAQRLSGQAEDTIHDFSAHADFEDQCSLCHQPLKTTQDELCLECHQGISGQIQDQQGTHGNIPAVSQCFRCHSEHRGRDFDMLAGALERFDHEGTGFSLSRHAVDYSLRPITCTDCHTREKGFPVQSESCVNCHSTPDSQWIIQHQKDFGSQCLACHDGFDRMSQFDHAETQFALNGKHAGLVCMDCHHVDQERPSFDQFAQVSKDCAGCHAEPELHYGLFEKECANCHTSDGWENVSWKGEAFEHFGSTGFSLDRHHQDYDGRPMRCTSCHQDSLETFDSQSCVSCHNQQNFTQLQMHQEKVGSNCLDCHDGVDRMMAFDHSSTFQLDGAHERLTCLDCHATGYREGSGDCVNCHSEPEIHAGFFGVNCQDCHTTQSWSPALLKNHIFPLDHGDTGLVACRTCHPDKFTQYTCYGCHEHQSAEIQSEHLEEGISAVELPECARCHPAGQEE